MPKPLGMAKLPNIDDFCRVHLNKENFVEEKKVHKSLGLLSWRVFNMPKPFGTAKLPNIDDFCRVHFNKVYFVYLQVIFM